MSSSEPPPFPQDELNPYAPPRSEVGPEMLLPADLRPMPFTIGDVLLRSWEIYRDRMGNCIGVVIGCMAINMLVQIVLRVAEAAAPQARNPEAFAAVVAIFGTLASFLFQTWINIGQMIVMLEIARGQEAPFSDVFTGGRFLLRTVVAILLFMALMVGAVALGAGPGLLVWAAVGRDAPAGIVALVLGVLAGIVLAILLGLRLSQFYYAIIERDAGIIESFQVSSRITRGNAGLIFVLILLTSAINFGGALACFVGLIFTMPFTWLLLIVTYLALTGQPTADPYSKGEPLAELEPL